VILGQDPYHSPKTAIGLSFAVEKGNRLPPSLQNIYKELETDLGIPRATHGDLSSWGAQGVLLLNAVLTVQQGKPGSHAGKGWEIFTDAVIKTISDQKENVVFILWGAYAQKKEALIDTKKHFVIKSAHPSPFSAHTGFFGSKPFSKTNEYLASKGLKEINWKV
jgi:uracil-DNA glycosylase